MVDCEVFPKDFFAKHSLQPNVERGGGNIISGIFRRETDAAPLSCVCPVLARFFFLNTTCKW